MTWIDESNIVTAEDKASETAQKVAFEARLSAIEAAIKAAGIASYTVEQAEDWIDQQYSGATTMVEGFAATKRIFKKVLPMLVRTRF